MDAKCKLVKLAFDKISEVKYGIKSVFNNALFQKFFINSKTECEISYPITEKCLELEDCINGIVYTNPDCDFELEVEFCTHTIASMLCQEELPEYEVMCETHQNLLNSKEAETTNLVIEEILEDSSSSVIEEICWFLPSRMLLNSMYQNLHISNIGGFQNSYYWSSTENTVPNPNTQAYTKNFDTGSIMSKPKNEIHRVRPVGYFESGDIYSLQELIDGYGWVCYIEYNVSPGINGYYVAYLYDAVPSKWGAYSANVGAYGAGTSQSISNTDLIIEKLSILGESGKAAQNCTALIDTIGCIEIEESSSSS